MGLLLLFALATLLRYLHYRVGFTTRLAKVGTTGV